MYSRKNTIETMLSTHHIRENECGIFVSISVDSKRKEVFEFEPCAPFFYRCSNASPGACANRHRITNITHLDSRFVDDGKLWEIGNSVIFEETNVELIVFVITTHPNSVKDYTFSIVDGCRCQCCRGDLCSNGRRILYTRFLRCITIVNHCLQ
jgi:hypothetical protein